MIISIVCRYYKFKKSPLERLHTEMIAYERDCIQKKSHIEEIAYRK